MGLTEDVVATACTVATAGASQIAACARGGASCEGWLKVELSHALGSLPGVAVAAELDNVDLTVRRGDELVLCELKTFPTNYGRGGKPITNFISGVVSDLEKLALRTNEKTRGLAIWMAYYIPEPVPPQWPDHLAKVRHAAAEQLRVEKIRLDGPRFAHLVRDARQVEGPQQPEVFVITAQDLKKQREQLRLDDADWQTHEKLKAKFAAARKQRDPMHLTESEFFEVARWKLINQYGRAQRLLERNSAERIEAVTSRALSFCDPDPDIEMVGRVTMLRVLPGVGMGVASAILALCFPEQYAPIDFRVWRQLFGTEKDMFELTEYRRYLGRLRELAAHLESLDPGTDWPVQLVDYFTWEYDFATS